MVRGSGRFDGEEFRRRRQATGLSQQRVAELVGSTRWQVIAYEQGRARPEPARLAALAAAVGCSPAVLTGVALVDLAGLRRAAGLTRVQAAARLDEVLGTRVPASKWLLEQTETGQVPVAWRFAAWRADVVAAMAQAYGQPVDVVARAWPPPVVAEPGEALPTPPNVPGPAAPVSPQPGAAEPAKPAGSGPARRSKAHTGWLALNDRQRAYLKAVFDDDQAAERAAKSGGVRATFAPKITAGAWRWRDFAIADPAADHTDIQFALRGGGVHDPGAGASLAALERRGLLLVRHDLRHLPILGPVTVVQVRMTTAGRAAARAGLGIEAPRKTPKGMLSRWLWKQLAKVAAAEPDGLASVDLWGEAHVYLGVGYRPGRHESRGYIDQHRPDWRWHLTDIGRAHVTEHLATYRQLYPDVPTDKISLP